MPLRKHSRVADHREADPREVGHDADEREAALRGFRRNAVTSPLGRELAVEFSTKVVLSLRCAVLGWATSHFIAVWLQRLHDAEWVPAGLTEAIDNAKNSIFGTTTP